jgi:hypothetical protein
MWKHIFAIVLAPLTATLGAWASNTAAGTHIPFTVGTILAPAVPIWINSILHLYQNPPNQPGA